jgi:hypothetical protein
MKWARHVARMGEMRNAYKVLVGNLKGRCHLEDVGVINKLWCEGVDSVNMAQDTDQWRALVDTAMNLRFPFKREIS